MPPFTGEATVAPSLRDAQDLREDPRLIVPSDVSAVFLEDQFRDEEIDLVEAASLEVVERVDPPLCGDPFEFRLRDDFEVRQGEMRVGRECGMESLARARDGLACSAPRLRPAPRP